MGFKDKLFKRYADLMWKYDQTGKKIFFKKAQAIRSYLKTAV